MKILIINQNTCNFGDDAAGVALLQQIESTLPNAEVSIIYSNHSLTLSTTTIPFHSKHTRHRNEIYFDKSIKMDFFKYLLTRIFRVNFGIGDKMASYISAVANSDIVLISPCGANIGIYKDWQFLIRTLIATLEKKRVVFHLNTIHKSHNFLFDLIAKYVLSRSSVYVRESKSHQSLLEWGINSIQGVDTAFSLTATEDEIQGYKRSFEQYIAFIPTDLSWHPNFRNIDNKNYLRKSISAITYFAVKNNLGVTVVPHLYGPMIEAKFLNEVVEIFLESGMPHNQLKLDWGIDSVWKYQEAIKRSKITVSMRYHGIVFAAKNSIPFVSISYENKMNEVCSYSGMSSFCIDAKSVTTEDLARLMNLAHKDFDNIKRELMNRHDFLVRNSRLVIDNIKLNH